MLTGGALAGFFEKSCFLYRRVTISLNTQFISEIFAFKMSISDRSFDEN